MKKIFYVLMALLSAMVCAFSLAGCGGNKETVTNSYTVKSIQLAPTESNELSVKGWVRQGDPQPVENSGTGTYYATDVCIYNSGAALNGGASNTIQLSDFKYGDVSPIGYRIYEEFEDVTDPDGFGRWVNIEFDTLYTQTGDSDEGYVRTYGKNLTPGRIFYNEGGRYFWSDDPILSLKQNQVWRLTLLFDELPTEQELYVKSSRINFRSASNGIDDYSVNTGFSNTISMCINNEVGQDQVYEAVSGQTVYNYTEKIENITDVTNYFVEISTMLVGDIDDNTELTPENFFLKADGKNYPCKGFSPSVSKNQTISEERESEIRNNIMTEYAFTDYEMDVYELFVNTDAIEYKFDSIKPEKLLASSFVFDFGLTQQPESYALFFSLDGTEYEITLRP